MRPSDVRAKPGELVIPRSTQAIPAWRNRTQVFGVASSERVGMIMPGSIGVVVSIEKGWTYVMWSVPCVAGWSSDGFLRPV